MISCDTLCGAARFSSTKIRSTLTSVSNLSTFMTQDEACKIKSLKENKDGFYRVFCHAPHFAVPQPVVLKYCTVMSLHISNIYAKKKGFAKKFSPNSSCQYEFLKRLTWLQVISVVLRGDAAAKTISVLSMRPLLIVPCLRHRAPHHCGDPDPSRTIGQTCVVSSSHRALNVSGK